MYPGELFRSFLPFRNPIGFGAADFVAFALALLLSLAIVARAALRPVWAHIGCRTGLVMALLAAATVVLRLALLPASPAPVGAGADDFSYLLSADTLAHARLANPAHPLPRFFESVFVLQQPTYSSIYPLGQGIALGLGRILLGSFWAGVLVSSAILAALTYWMLRGWISESWAAAGGLVALIAFGPLSQWTNSYWGGALSGCAGCLVFGALPRLTEKLKRRRVPAALLGGGLALQLLTRPFELLLLGGAVVLYVLVIDRRLRLWSKVLAWALLPLAAAAGLTLLQNKKVTDSWATLPYMLSRFQYGVPSTFTFQANPVPHRELTPEQELNYRAQSAIHGSDPDSFPKYAERLWYRVRYLRFFVPAPLYLAALFFLPDLRMARWRWLAAAIVLFLAGTNFYPYFFPHYVAAAGCLIILASVRGLENLSRLQCFGIAGGRLAAQALLGLCAAHLAFWFIIHAIGGPSLLPVTQYESWDFINSGDPDGRRAVARALAEAKGPQLVFVRYGARHRFSEWIANAADIDSSPVVWARDLGDAENENLIRYFPNRTAWLLEPDAVPPHLVSYQPKPNSFQPIR